MTRHTGAKYSSTAFPDRSGRGIPEELDLLRILIENLPDSVYVKDMQGRILICNSELAGRLGSSKPEELVGETDFAFFPKEEAERLHVQEQNIIKTGRPLVNEDVEILDKRTGRPMHLLTTKLPLRNRSGKIIGILGVGRNITQQKEAEEARAALTEELKRKNIELESVMDVASHDLRAALVNIQGFSHELRASCELIVSSLGGKNNITRPGDAIRDAAGKRIPEAVGFIMSNAVKMDSLLDGLLQVLRLTRTPVKIRPLNMNTLVESIATSMKSQIQQAGAEVKVEALPVCLGDYAGIRDVFRNLLCNAIAFLDESRRGKIIVSGTTKNDRCIYCVSDNGIGIAPRHQDRIFELFRRLDPGGRNGVGLGLTIVRRMLDRQKGKVWVESEPGKGAKFFVSLPAAK